MEVRRLAWGAVLACMVSITVPAPSSAQVAEPQPASEARDAEARGLFEAGRAAFADGRFEDARDYFRRAHTLSGRPALLYNLGAAEDRLRNDAAALEAFEGYLAATPDAENASEVRARIEVLRRSVAADVEPAPDPSPPPRASGPTVVWTFALAGIALAAGGGAIGTWVAANDQYASLERGCLALRGACPESDISGVEGLVTATNVLFISSLVLAAGAGVALAVELSSGSSDDATHARVGFGPGSIVVEGAF